MARTTTKDEIFNDSYERCLAQGDFIDRFYVNYLASSDLVAQKFANTKMDQQKRMLDGSLHMIMALGKLENEDAVTYFKKLGATHGRHQHNIEPELYDLWLDCLLDTVRDCDDQFNTQVDAAWRELLVSSIDIMKSAY